MSFQDNFTRTATFKWFVTIILGIMIRADKLGITSIIRNLKLPSRSYASMMHFFRSTSFDLNDLRHKWMKITKEHAPLYTYQGTTILIGDGVKQAKEARKMPGVKKLHQESENSSKAEYIHGHHHGGLGILAGNEEKLYCLPISLKIHDGISHLQQAESSEGTLKTDSHVVKMIKDGYDATQVYGDSLILLDRLFLSVPALQTLDELNDSGTKTLNIITKAKRSCIAYEKPPAIIKKRRGRPRKKGTAIKLHKLFDDPTVPFTKETLELYGESKEVEYYCTNLLWGQGYYRELRFVLVKYDNICSILVTTQLDIEPAKIIELYSLRFKIECTFRELKQVVGGFSYQFWNERMPKLNRFKRKDAPDPLMTISQEDCDKILNTVKAIETYMLLSSIALGLLQILGLKLYKTTQFTSPIRYLRTISNKVPSEATVAYSLRQSFLWGFAHSKALSIMQIIHSKQDHPTNDKAELAS